MNQHEDSIPSKWKHRLTEAFQRLIDLYTAWDKPEEAAKWQAILDTAKAVAEKQVEE